MNDRWNEILDRITSSVGDFLPDAAAAVGILLLGWIIAILVSRAVRGGLGKTPLNRWAGRIWKPVAGDDAIAEPPPLNSWIGRVLFYVIILIAIVAAFEVLGSAAVVDPINATLREVLTFLPNVAAALVVTFIAWLIASIIRAIVRQAIVASGFDRRVGASIEENGGRGAALAQMAGDVAFWLVIVLFLPAILAVLSLDGLLTPVGAMVTEILGFIPNLVGAAIILVVGWLLARVLRGLVTNVASGLGVDALATRVGVTRALGTASLSGLLGMVAYALVIIPAIILALEALELESVSAPASQMLESVFTAIPAVAVGILILVVAYIVGRILRDIVSNLLESVGFNTLPVRLGFTSTPIEGAWRPSWVVGYAVLVALLLIATLQVGELLGSEFFTNLVLRVIVIGGSIVAALVALGIGIWLANLAARAIQGTAGQNANLLAGVVRWAIILLTVAIALRQIGIANEIIILAFGVPLAAVAVAFAVAFGIGGRATAARELDAWLERRRGNRGGGGGSGTTTRRQP